jgi:hypothetical protein
MAEEIACPACETPNDPWNEVCEECGAALHADAEAPVQDDATDGDEFVEPDAQGESVQGDPGGFEGVEEVQAYDEDNPDYGVAEELVEQSDQEHSEAADEAAEEIHEAVEYGDDELAEVPDEGYEFAEDTGAEEVAFSPEDAAQGHATEPAPVEGDEQIAGHELPDNELPDDELAEDEPDSIEYELEVIEDEVGEDDAQADEDEWNDAESQPEDDQFDGGTSLDPSSDESFDGFEDDGFEDDGLADDEVAADGGAPLAAEAQLDGSADVLVPDSGVELDTDSDFDADSDAGFEEFAAQEDSEGGDEFDDEFDDQFNDGLDEEVAAESEVEEEPPPPPELEAILNPQQVDRTPIEPLPTPGPYAELATLTVLRGGEQLGEVAIDFNCTVLGLDGPDDAAQEAPNEHAADAQVADEDDVEEVYELEAIEPIEAESNEAAAEDQGFDDAYELEAIEEESSPAFDLDEESGLDEDSALGEESDWDMADEDDAFADSEVDEASEAALAYEDPDDLEEGPVIDLSQFGDQSRFARRHGYLFRQNKHYTLYVLSDMGTQVNDEMLELGEYRELSDGDVIVLGGEVALKFNKPAA